MENKWLNHLHLTISFQIKYSEKVYPTLTITTAIENLDLLITIIKEY
jgi:hypothetical protein